VGLAVFRNPARFSPARLQQADAAVLLRPVRAGRLDDPGRERRPDPLLNPGQWSNTPTWRPGEDPRHLHRPHQTHWPGQARPCGWPRGGRSGEPNAPAPSHRPLPALDQPRAEQAHPHQAQALIGPGSCVSCAPWSPLAEDEILPSPPAAAGSPWRSYRRLPSRRNPGGPLAIPSNRRDFRCGDLTSYAGRAPASWPASRRQSTDRPRWRRLVLPEGGLQGDVSR
jgi:hypothetical protein